MQTIFDIFDSSHYLVFTLGADLNTVGIVLPGFTAFQLKSCVFTHTH